MSHKVLSVAVLAIIAVIWFGGATQHEKRVVSDIHSSRVAELEGRASKEPSEPANVRALAQAYLDARAPGMAIATIERAPDAARQDPTVEHLYARALLDQGRTGDALAAENRVLARCLATEGDAPTCSSHLVASATRRSAILEELVALGVEDAHAQPEASSLAYHTATRQVSYSIR